MSYVNPLLAKMDISSLSAKQINDALDQHFSALRKFVIGVVNDRWHLIVNGDAGMGKTETVGDVLDAALKDKKSPLKKVERISGTVSAVMLFSKLQDCSKKGSVLVIDDTDKILEDTECLEVLKASFDTKPGKLVDWTKYSTVLNKKNLKTQFKYEGRCIIITNKMLRTAPSETPTTIQQRIAPLLSRVHYFRAGVPNNQWKIAAIKMHQKGYKSKSKSQDITYQLRCFQDLDVKVQNKIVNWLDKNQDDLREVSFRTCATPKELIAEDEDLWEILAESSLLV